MSLSSSGSKNKPKRNHREADTKFFDPEGVGDMFSETSDDFPTYYTALYPRKQNFGLSKAQMRNGDCINSEGLWGRYIK
jgi:hypothetical protein